MLFKIRIPPRAIVKWSSYILAVILFWVELCSCDVRWGIYYKQENSRLTTFYDQMWKITNSACFVACHIDSSCKSVSYNPGSKECQLSDVNLAVAGVNSENNDEWATFSSTDPKCNDYLVSGENGVKDSQLTESAYYCQFKGCANSTDTSAIHARLNSKGLLTGAWLAPDFSSVTDYIQVDFRIAKPIAAIALQGRDTSGGLVYQYVTSFKVLTSLDCDKFTYISNGTVADVIFEGNSSPDQIVVRYLPDKVIARCVRIKPIEYFGVHKSLRFDVLGC